MLVDNSVYRNSYEATGTSVSFAISFPFLDPTHIVVYRSLQDEETIVSPSEYTITGAGDARGGTITFNSAPVAGATIVILRDVPITQLYQYEELDNFSAKSHEDALAKLTMICQQQQEQLDRSIQLPPTSPLTQEQFTEKLFDASEDAVNAAASSSASANESANSAANAAQSKEDAKDILDQVAQTGADATNAIVSQQKLSEAAVAEVGEQAIAETERNVTSAQQYAANAEESAKRAEEAATSGLPDQTDAEGQSLVSVGGNAAWWPVAENVLNAAKAAASGSEGESDIYEPLIGTVAHEMGSWWISLDSSIPVGGLPHLGHLCSRATYGDFWTWCELNKTVVSDEEWLAYAEAHNDCCPYYSYGDGSTTFRTPKYDQSFLKVLAVIGDTGQMQEAGLPNINGTADMQGSTITSGDGNFGYTTGVFNVTARGLHGSGNSASNTYINSIDFDASRSSPVYGNSDTVTPQNFGIIVGVYAVGAVSAPIGETDAANLLNGLSTLEIEKLSRGDKAEIVGWGMPDYSAGIDFARPVEATPYTAPCAGWYVTSFQHLNGEDQLVINGVDSAFAMSSPTSNRDRCTIVVPLCKGDVIYWKLTGGTCTTSMFYPLKGAN